MKWHHIMEKQPENDEDILLCEDPYHGHYFMGMTKYYQKSSFEEYLFEIKKRGYPLPNFWWISAKDFPWPNKEMKNDKSDENYLWIELSDTESMKLNIDSFIMFVIGEAFGGLDYTDPLSVEIAIKKYLKDYIDAKRNIKSE